jgi:uncharacterized repeat protein (TIGR03803 family)
MEKTMQHHSRLLGLLSLAFMTAAGSASAQTDAKVKNEYTFCKQTQCDDGKNPSGTLIHDGLGNLYGTTVNGGVNGGGTVYELILRPTGGFREKVLYNFCLQNNCADGAHPLNVRLVLDAAGNLYGTTSSGGSTQHGTIFQLVPNTGHTHWTLVTLYNFCQDFSDCSDGSQPEGALTYTGQQAGTAYDGTSPLFGTTLTGGRHHLGVVYSLEPAHGGGWTEKLPYIFCSNGGSNCTDGKTPTGGLIMDSSGNLYGTAAAGGANGGGVVFKLTPTLGIRYALTPLYEFCSADGCTDGATPSTGVVMDSAQTLYGTTAAGGIVTGPCGATGCGTVFKITHTGVESQLYAFCTVDACADGSGPNGLSIDASSNLFGGTADNGNGGGTLYEISAAGAFSTLFTFNCGVHKCNNGQGPSGNFLVDGSERLTGAMQNRGKHDGGVIIQFTPATQ